MGTARPLFRIGDERIVLNDSTSQTQIPFPFQEKSITHEGCFSPCKIWKYSRGFRGIFNLVWEHLDRPSHEKLLEIIESNEYFYFRPHFNFFKEYEVVLNPQNPGTIDRIGTVARQYKGNLVLVARETLASHPKSYGAFSFNGSTKIDCTLAETLNGDCSVEMWIKTPRSFSSKEELFSISGNVDWTVNITTDGALEFLTDDGTLHQQLTGYAVLTENSWHFVTVTRADTDSKKICVDGKCEGVRDEKAANAITAVTLGASSDAFSKYCQIFRVYNEYTAKSWTSILHSIEAIRENFVNSIKLWWDSSQGDFTDLSGKGNDGTITGTENYSKESFPDNGFKMLT